MVKGAFTGTLEQVDPCCYRIPKSYKQGMKRARLYRRAEVAALVRLERRGFPDIPPAENWIRD